MRSASLTGEALALLAALFSALAGVAIGRAKPTARGDNGVFLSVLATLSLSLAIWAILGTTRLGDLTPWVVALFALAGLCSVVLGRLTMYRATERIGPISASLLRRLTPIFAVPAAFLLLGEVPSGLALLGGGLILAGVAFYLGAPGPLGRVGLALGVASAAFYATAYSLRAAGLAVLPDAALGTAIGALIGLVWFPLAALWGAGLRSLVVDRGPWHLTAAAALTIGQVLQFFALGHAPVATVAVLGALDALFAALLMRAFGTPVALGRLALATTLAAIGTALILA
ncbi:EamA family transporter [Jannaschia sp.]|nr:EamA family transporter [Jannaschia sp.]